MQSSVSSLDYAILAIYFILILGVGYFFHRKSKSVEGFTAANRSLPAWLTGLSILGTYVSSISFLAVPGKAFASDWNAFAFSLSLFIAAPIAVRFFLPHYRLPGTLSAYEALESHFGTWARVYASACYLLTQLARMGTVMYLMALPLHLLLGWDLYIIICITGVAVTAYTFMGGITAVIWTDAIQTIILIIGALSCLGIMLVALPGGVSGLFLSASESNKFSFGSFGLEWSTSTFWITLIYGVFINLNNFGIDQNYVQRYIASKSNKEARRSIWIGGLLYIPVSAIFFFIGTALFAFYQNQPDRLPLLFQGKPDQVFPWFIIHELPVGMTGLLIAAIFAAAMSTVSTSLNSSSTVLLSDYYQRFICKQASEKQSMRFILIATLIMGLLGTLMALTMTTAKNVLDAWWSYAGIFSGGMLGLFILSISARKIKSAGAMIATLAGVILILWMSLSPTMQSLPEALRSPFHNYLIIVFGTTTIVLVGFLTTLLKLPKLRN